MQIHYNPVELYFHTLSSNNLVEMQILPGDADSAYDTTFGKYAVAVEQEQG